jgi:putative restriction endonuclease
MPRIALPPPEDSPEPHWLAKFGELNAAPLGEKGTAPHKPLLLFCVLDMFESGSFRDGRVEMSAELVFRFECNWAFVIDRVHSKPDIRLPFHALGSNFDKVWTRWTEDGRPSAAREATRVVQLDPTLLRCLESESFRRKARVSLLGGRYFTPSERVALAAAMAMKPPIVEETERLREDAAIYKASREKGRCTRFKVEVLTRYGFTCALTGYRLSTERGHLVEAAHIHQRAASLNDEPDNGLALTPDAHWMFDHGLWTVDERRCVRVASEKAFSEWAPPGFHLLAPRNGAPLFFRDGCRHRPDWNHFAWHRRERFQG